MTNKKKYKALMLDLDGTLIINHHDALPSVRVREALEKARGIIHIGIATGRPLHHLHNFLENVSLSGPSIINGGIQIMDGESQKILKEKRINKNDILPILSIAKTLGITIDIVEDDKDVTYNEGYQLKNPLSIYTQPLDEESADIFIANVSHIPTISAHKTSSWIPKKVHVAINHISATKQHGILEVAQILGINREEIIGVGDHYNDFPLLMACGLKVAMGNAVEDLKAIADYIAPTVEEDGVADVIEKFILQ
ncbi:MAG TPA: HAD-IIB family hydrolase [Candidatus Saccharimonadales bacterium]|nr:HAD-IIB family hydrolase [Candidatus Saccharimonadales bacterium]